MSTKDMNRGTNCKDYDLKARGFMIKFNILYKKKGDYFILENKNQKYIAMIWPGGHRDETRCFKLINDDVIMYSNYEDMASFADKIRNNYSIYKIREVPTPDF
ncbi:hypothetical protein FJU30_17365 [Affinibrenneria salicis]|uniref:Uncharacterized protein n=1 Tax=Affinibrenneria salicis TaxID=2590031 RepID=A0A5J5FWM8_9GAMM|nr:hypothetical protein [Affinibrenneria salicis]KAA8998182.1 hypothetical protein FJU30_17365 [Affinibrenneria salicis]